MDNRYHIIEYLYGEGDQDAARRLLEDAALRDEFDRHRSVKHALDARPSARPSPATLDVVLAAADAAATGSAPPNRARADRPARRRRAGWWLRTSVAVCTVVLAAAVAVWQFGGGTLTDSAMPTTADMEEAPAGEHVFAEERAAAPARAAEAEPEPMEAASVPSGERAAFAEASPAPAPDETEPATGGDQPALALSAAPARVADTQAEPAADRATEAALPDWDVGGRLVQVHRSIELLEARSDEAIWDEPTVSLDVFPAPAASRLDRGLNTVGTQRQDDPR